MGTGTDLDIPMAVVPRTVHSPIPRGTVEVAKQDRWTEFALTVYVGGPIDFAADDPDVRHREVAMALATRDIPASLFCPFCDQTRDVLGPRERIERNSRYLLDADRVVFVWNVATQPSIGSSVEMWERLARGQGLVPPAVIGNEPGPAAMFVSFFRQQGALWFESYGDWADHVRETRISPSSL